MKDIVGEALLENWSSRKVKILVGPRGSGKMDYLENVFIPFAHSRDASLRPFTLSARDGLVQTILDESEKCPHTLFLLKDIYLAKDYTAIADTIASHPTARLIATSNTFLPFGFEDRLNDPTWVPTAARGRITKVFFPATIWTDYAQANPNKGVLDFLFSRSIDLGILERSIWASRSEKMKRVSAILLEYSGQILTNRLVQRLYEKEFAESVSINTVINIASLFKNHCLFYFVDRFDLKKDKVLASGSTVYPVTVAMFPEALIDDASIAKRAEAELVGQWFYEGFQVYRACHAKQSFDHGERGFAMADDGFLLCKGAEKRLASFAVRLNEETVRSVKTIPSGYRKTIVVAEMSSSKAVLEDGIEAISLERALNGGLLHD
ncbi:MAG: hypothetical protein SPL80_02985 [Bacilli bacterium]|nr:hypothetical protein [Bacilli bacterium]